MDQLRSQGFSITNDVEKADVLVLNTCGFITPAVDESVNVISQYVDFVAQRPVLLAVVGCLVQRYRDELAEEIPQVDIWLGVSDLQELPRRIKDILPNKAIIPQKSYTLGQSRITPEYFAYIKIADGCNHRCAFCVIPAIRGKYKSRAKDEIIENARAAAQNGAKEVCLVAQDVSGYGFDLSPATSLPELLRSIEQIDPIRWIRLMYLYPDKITDELIDTIVNSEKICKYLDIPFQHISTKILKSMGRRETMEKIFSLVEKLRYRIPDLSLRTTVIVGFPGETDEDFDLLYEGVRQLRFDRMGVFMYSDEEGTRAERMAGKITSDVMEQRYHKLMQLQRTISEENLKKYVGKDIQVIIEDSRETGEYVGRSRWDAPEIDGSVIVRTNTDCKLLPGDIIMTRITNSFEYDLEGLFNEYCQ
jgi:ribosomal protein S12 methylthiotransferase